MTGSRFMFAEDFAEYGMSVPYIRKRLVEARKLHAAGQATPSTLPLPCDTVSRLVSNGHHPVTAHSPRWRRADVKRWLAGRPGRGAAGHPRPGRRSPAA
jgi:hypothetical protein